MVPDEIFWEILKLLSPNLGKFKFVCRRFRDIIRKNATVVKINDYADYPWGAKYRKIHPYVLHKMRHHYTESDFSDLVIKTIKYEKIPDYQSFIVSITPVSQFCAFELLLKTYKFSEEAYHELLIEIYGKWDNGNSRELVKIIKKILMTPEAKCFWIYDIWHNLLHKIPWISDIQLFKMLHYRGIIDKSNCFGYPFINSIECNRFVPGVVDIILTKYGYFDKLVGGGHVKEALVIAIRRNYFRLFNVLIKHRYHPDIEDYAICYAIECKRIAMLNLMLENAMIPGDKSYESAFRAFDKRYIRMIINSPGFDMNICKTYTKKYIRTVGIGVIVQLFQISVINESDICDIFVHYLRYRHKEFDDLMHNFAYIITPEMYQTFYFDANISKHAKILTKILDYHRPKPPGDGFIVVKRRKKPRTKRHK